MKKEEIHLWDIKRILFGQAPPEFLLEVLIRTLIMYVGVIIITRLLGKRMNGQLTIIELSIMVMMGAILAVPMQIPDRGILQGILLLFCVLLLLRGVNWLGFKNSRFEKVLQGEGMLLVKDGVMQLPALSKTKITKQQLFARLRGKKIMQLGQVKRMYIEACGLFSIYTEEAPKPGLSVLPRTDDEMLKELKLSGEKVCTNCGLVQPPKTQKPLCPNCGSDAFIMAVS
jgi:uncharacterized membrane protein YcaP (DUF421 family)